MEIPIVLAEQHAAEQPWKSAIEVKAFDRV